IVRSIAPNLSLKPNMPPLSIRGHIPVRPGPRPTPYVGASRTVQACVRSGTRPETKKPAGLGGFFVLE
ncbi:MAG: hypothetical protein RR303_05425, partial [Bacteroidales bacterium]